MRKAVKIKQKAKVEFKKTSAGNQKGAWRYTVKGGNGETLATSEGYTTKQDAERGFCNLVSMVLELLPEGRWITKYMG